MNGSLENEKLVNLGREIRVGNELGSVKGAGALRTCVDEDGGGGGRLQLLSSFLYYYYYYYY
jgi:hypothetical protein